MLWHTHVPCWENAPKVKLRITCGYALWRPSKMLFYRHHKTLFYRPHKTHTLAKSVGGVYYMTNEVSQVEPRITCEVSQVEPRITSELLQVYPCITNKLLQVYPRITNCLSPNVVTILVIQVFWRWRNMALAINAITSITLVAVGVVGITFVVTIAPFLGAFVEFMNFSVLEMGTISAYRWIPVSRVVGLRPWGASCRPSVRRSPRPSFRRRRGAGWRRCTLLNWLAPPKRC